MTQECPSFDLDDYDRAAPSWCSGCGDYRVLEAFKEVCVEKQIAPHELAIVSGIGCSSRFPYFVQAYGYHGVHGRALPTGVGVKEGNPELTVMVVGGDGDGLAIGGGHIAHVARKNVDLTYLLFDNSIYGLTKGQMSPTSRIIERTTTTPYGIPEDPVNPIDLLLTYGAGFVARGCAIYKDHLRGLIRQAMEHRGFAFVQILTYCGKFNRTDISADAMAAYRFIPPSHDAADHMAATRLARDPGAPYLGVFYRTERPTLRDRLVDIQQRAQRGKGPVTVDSLLAQFA